MNNDEEWNPERDLDDAARVFGAGVIGPNDQFSEITPPVPPSNPPKAPGRPTFQIILGTSFIAALGLSSWMLQDEIRRSDQTEQQMESLAEQIALIKLSRSDPQELPAKIDEALQHLDELDETVSQLAAAIRLQNASTLQSDYSIQHTQKALLRQETELGKLALKLGNLEHEVLDTSRQAKENFELSVKKRKEAELAAVPIRRRITELEARKNTLFAQYRAGSLPRRPHGVVSSRRASEMMKEYETKAAPLLAQIQTEISRIRELIEDEESKIDDLFER
jgi:hypothetical protein